MPKITSARPKIEFTAQSRNVMALLHMYEQLDSSRRKAYELLPIIVFAGFAIESYLNSLGARRLPIWDELERLPWRKKISILHKSTNNTATWSEDPLQFATEIFSIRDRLAHGKPELVFGPEFVEVDAASALLHSGRLEPDWYLKITSQWVRDTRPRFERLMAYLAALYRLDADDYLHVASPSIEVKVEHRS